MALNTNGLRKFRAGLEQAMDEGIERAAGFVADLAQQLAPEDTGGLKSSKTVEQVQSGTWRVGFGRGLPDERALAQEYGTASQPAQPYLAPAVSQVDIVLEVKASIKDLIDRSRK